MPHKIELPFKKMLKPLKTECKNKGCPYQIVLGRQLSKGRSNLKKCTGHNETLFGQRITHRDREDRKYCTPVYTAEQVSRALGGLFAADPKRSARLLAEIIPLKQIYTLQPPSSHFRQIRYELLLKMSANRAVEMSAMGYFTYLLDKYGHKSDWIVLSRLEMRRLKLKYAAHIFEQRNKSGEVGKDDGLDENAADLDDIYLDGWYYGDCAHPAVAYHICVGPLRIVFQLMLPIVRAFVFRHMILRLKT